jgi:alpha-L-arabinofuranosidase
MATIYFVSNAGADEHDGTPERPLRTISAAAARAVAGDSVRVSAGTYRERVNPPRGGTSPSEPITYFAAPGERVVITGSESFAAWVGTGDDLWHLVIPNSYFGSFNPYAEVVHGDWFDGLERVHRRGNVYLDGVWLPEVTSYAQLREGSGLGWTSTVDGLRDRLPAEVYGVEGKEAFEPAKFDPSGNTTIVARLPRGVDPNGGRVEVAVRPTVFTPTEEHIDFITVRGFEIRNAATNWVSPTAGQEGAITPYWSRGWVIEDNEICYSRCAGIALAKNRDEFDGERGTTEGYYFTIEDAQIRDNWSSDTIGSHVVRNNRIHHCGQVGIAGSLGCAFSTIEGNEIHDCNLQGIWSGAEMAGIKLHGAIDVVIRGNHLYRCGEPAAIWLDWLAQGTQVFGNFMHDNMRDVYLEVNHGPIVMANNIMLSKRGIRSNSRGVVFAHNLVVGTLEVLDDARETPYLKPHTTELQEMRRLCSVGDSHWVNNILGPAVDLGQYDNAVAALPCSFVDNVRLVTSSSDWAEVELATDLEERDGVWVLTLASNSGWNGSANQLATESFAAAMVPHQLYTEPAGRRMVIDHDFQGKVRGFSATPGPFEPAVVGAVAVWSLQEAPTFGAGIFSELISSDFNEEREESDKINAN